MDVGLFVDIFVALVLIGSALIAFLRGFIREVLTIMGIVGGSVAAYFFAPHLMPLMRDWFGVVEGKEEEAGALFGVVPYPILADGLSYAAIFIVVVIFLSIISHFMAEFAKKIGLGPLDRTLGVVFGLGRGIVVLGLLNLVFYFLLGEETKKDLKENSKLYIYVDTTSQWFAQFWPKDLEESIQEGKKNAEEISETRKKLEELGVLDSMQKAGDVLEKSSEEMKGYGEDFRNEMDMLIEQAHEGTDQAEEE